jgi:hypothetical protein
MPNETTTKEDKSKNKNNAPPSGAATTAPTKPAPTAMTAPTGGTAAMAAPMDTQALVEFDYGEDMGRGFENQDMSDRKLPLIELLQSNSPEVAESKGKVWAGQFRNTVTGEIYDEVFFVPAITDHCWTEWVPRDDGGGFRGRHPKNAKIVADAIARNDGRAIGKLKVPQPPDAKTQKPQPDHELVESFEIYCILFDAKTGEVLGFAMIPFVSTKIKVYRAWNSAIGNFAPTFYGVKDASGQSQGQFMSIEPAQARASAVGGTVHPIKLRPGAVPIFGHRVKMMSESETKGTNTYMVPVLTPAEGGDDLKNSLLPKNDPRYIEAKKLHDDVLKGLAKAAYETTKQEPGVDPESGVPF